MLHELSDRSLLQMFQTGNEEAAAELYGRYAERLDFLATRGLGSDLRSVVGSDDVVQSIFRTFFRRASEGEYEVPDGAELWNLLVTITMNKVRAVGVHYRRQKRNIGKTRAFDTETDAPEGTDDLAYHLLRIVVDDLLETLPEAHRQIVRLQIEGWNVGEIASETQRSKRTVERVLQQFRLSLHEMISNESNEQLESRIPHKSE